MILGDRLFVGTDGTLQVDWVYARLGHPGRTAMDRLVGGYNREAILSCLESQMTRRRAEGARQIQNLTSPYVLGNFRTYGTPIQQFFPQILDMADELYRLQSILTILAVDYRDDPMVIDRIRRLEGQQEAMSTALSPAVDIARGKTARI
jgi:hypothetical protein